MEFVREYSDIKWGNREDRIGKQPAVCTYCGCASDTKDHVPARCFFVKPYPRGKEVFCVVPACTDCNNSSSLDEDYTAFVIDFMKLGDDCDELKLKWKTKYNVLKARLLAYVQIGLWKDCYYHRYLYLAPG